MFPDNDEWTPQYDEEELVEILENCPRCDKRRHLQALQ